ncbi:interleukin-12 receptor subunit beta-2 [Eleutherodactylus coqui]|uniref:interleukin-12 receptor subunit beta-2 n=1 Tax=Eleutherodactylus coqui TaxID=57060 RepID=UPI003461B1AB
MRRKLMERRLWNLWMTVNITIAWMPMKPSVETCRDAEMKATPGTVIQHGHPINLTCTLTSNAKHCRSRSKDVKIYRDSTLLPGTLNTESVMVQDLLPLPGETKYRCEKCKVLCMISVFSGFPPGQPRSVTCEQEGEVGNMSCSWESGRETFIETTCTLQLLHKSHNVNASSKCSSQAHQTLMLPLSISVGGEYTVLVQASNELGENVSMPYTFTYFDVVKPSPPSDMTVTCNTSHDCTVSIHTYQDVQHFRLRYRITNESVWEQLQAEILSNRTLTLHHLRPLSQYELQAACKYKIDRGKWSNWSNIVTHKTPEDAPQEKIVMWYRINQTITIFWKYMNLSEFRGQIQFYQVIFQDNGRHATYIQNTTDTWLSRNIDPEGCVITVSAHNSMGSSPPTSIRVTSHSLAGLPAPTNVSAITSGSESITVRWELPPGIESAEDQIVAWEDPTGESLRKWITVPKSNRSAIISGHLKPHICYRLYVYLLWERRAGLPGMAHGSTRQTAPLTAPQFKYEVHKENAILVTWKEISAELRLGCITHYSIYLRAQTTQVFKIPSNQSLFYQYEIDNIGKNVHYSLEMTSSNEAGESPRSPLISAYIQADVSEDITMVVVFVVVLLFVGFLFSIPFAKQRLQFLLSSILPQWCSKPVPDPANCKWAKEYIASEEKREILTKVASSISDYSDETETLEIEEITNEEEEFLASVFSYKINNVAIGIPQENIRTLREDVAGIAPAQTLNREQRGVQKFLEADHPPDYLFHHNMQASDYLPHIKAAEYLAQHGMKPSDCQVHQDIRLSNSMIHRNINPFDYLVHHDTPADYLAHYEIKPSDFQIHTDIRLLNAIVSRVKPSAYLVNCENTVDYLPTNMLTIMEGPDKEKDLLHPQIFLTAGERTANTIRLDTVEINFPRTVQGDPCLV